MRLWTQIRRNKEEINWKKDIIAGIIVALVSIPISMGYAQLSGLPVVYGLYGSLLPVIVYGLMTTSRQFVAGVDAMPAVMVGGLLAEFQIAYESEEAMGLAALLSILTALWFVFFYFIKAGRVVKYISKPVMGGFISGVGLTIILMQIPKLFGGSAGTGDVFVLLGHIGEELAFFHWPPALLGFGTVAIILACKKWIPKVPMTAIMMAVGALLQWGLHLEQWGVKVLPEVAGGLPSLSFPDLRLLSFHTKELLIESLSIAAVIMAQTLLATGNYAMKYNDEVDNNAELLAYAGMNLMSGLVGCCPINGSVSRSGIADSFGCRSQVMSLSAGATMLLVLLFGTPLLKYLPVPVLTGIVLCALIGILETKLFKKLWNTSKNECVIFMLAFLGVLVLGTVNGVVIGVLLSFFEVAIRAVNPSVSYLGRIEGQDSFYTLERNKAARPIKNTVIYRFSGNLFFANIDRFQKDIEQSIKEDTKQIIVDARGIASIDFTAAERLVTINHNLRSKGVHFYLTEHDGSLNDQLRSLGAGILIEEGAVRRTISLALRDAGVYTPYQLEGETEQREVVRIIEEDEKLLEFEWAFGKDAKAKLLGLASITAENLIRKDAKAAYEEKTLDLHGIQTRCGKIGLFDENEFLDYVEIRLEKYVQEGKLSAQEASRLEQHIEKRRKVGEDKLSKLNPHAIEMLIEHRNQIREQIREKYPEEYKHLEEIRKML